MTNRFKQPAFPLGHIENTENARDFIGFVINKLDVNFHPDTPFEDYIKSEKPSFTQEEAELANILLDECFEVCERENADIYELTADVFSERLERTA